jgi:flagellar biosynthesis/type III secretory pathway ATPase
VGGVLLECVDSDEDEVKGFCTTLYTLLTGGDKLAESAEQDSARLLDSPVQLSTKLKVEGEIDHS